jgi:hypothetical protein
VFAAAALQKELHTSDIGAKLRASKANQANSRPQTQMLLDKPVALQQTSGAFPPLCLFSPQQGLQERC